MQQTLPDLEFDTRPIFARGDTPCHDIDDCIARLQPGQRLVISVPFEPIPLYSKFGKLGFTHTTEQPAPGVWRVAFTPGESASKERCTCSCSG